MISTLPAQFINWYPVVNEDGDIDKIPCRTNGTMCDAHNPAHHVSYDTASQSQYGVAFVLTADDPYFFLDLDKCRDEAGAWTANAQAIFMSFAGALGEMSTSGNGLHVLGKCQPHLLQDRKNRWDGWLEFYTQGRFIAFGDTGWDVIGGGEWQPEADWTPRIQQIVPVRPDLGELPEGVDPAYTGPADDAELITKMLSATGGAAAAFGGRATVAQLWNNDPVLATHYPDGKGGMNHSDADAALIAHLAFWTGRDMVRMDRLFRQSSLMRPKWDVAHRHDGATYGRMTIEGGARLCTRVYDFERPADRAPKALPAPEVYLTVPEQIEHFAGCVYVMDQHKMLSPEGDLLKPEQFNAFYGGHIFQMNPDGTQPEKKAFTAFTENRTHRFPKVRHGVFDPEVPGGTIVGDTVSTYFAQDVVMNPGDISRFHDLMTRLLSSASDRAILLAWMASCVQNPHRKFQWAPVLQGAEGNGKTFLMNCVAYAIGEGFTHRPNPKELAATHNGWMERALFVLVEEIHMDGRRDMLDSLKWKVTNERIPIRAMATDERTVRNFSKFGFCTNYMEAVLKSQNDRRYAIFFTSQQSASDIIRDGMGGGFFPSLYNWARDEGGYAAIAHFLSTYQIPAELDPAGLCHRAPNTSSTALAIKKSQGAIENEILEATEDGTIGFRDGWISSIKLDDLLRSKNLRVSRNKRYEILGELGYVRCAALPEGRTPSRMVQEDNKRPVLFVSTEAVVGPDPVHSYRVAQGYDQF